MVNLKKVMQSVMMSQLKQQHEFLEHQKEKEKANESTLKLPKFDMLSFSGDKLKWDEFWDSFESAIHKNKKLPKIEKFNYLKSKLSGDAQKAISGLPLSNDNYDIAIDILKTRFGRDQELVDLHYTQLINLQPATNKINSLRSLLNNIEKHLRCLSVLKQNIEQDVFVAMIRAKLPDEVLFQLEMVNGSKNKWTVEKLRERLDDYITARER